MASQSLKNLPPQMARELRRHIKPSMSQSNKGKRPGTADPSTAGQQQGSSSYVLAGCITFTMVSALIPIAAHYWVGGLNDREKPLTAPQVRRGAFMNSGTKDVGRDPNWDFSKGEYKEETGYARIRGQFLAASDEDLKKHESKLVSSVFCSRRRIRNLPKYVVHRHAGIIRQRSRKEQLSAVQPVSYTHLTLPTICSV